MLPLNSPFCAMANVCIILFHRIAVFMALLEILFCNSVLHCSTFLKISTNILKMNLILKTSTFGSKPVV